MSEVLVLVEHHDGAIGKVTGELLAAASRLGSPAAVVVGKPGTAEAMAGQLGALGAATGLANASTVVVDGAPRPPRTGGQKVTDDGTGGAKVAEYLAAARLI